MECLGDDRRSYRRDRGGLAGENLKRNLEELGEEIVTLKAVPSALPANKPTPK
jgi:hypothetical protein